MKNLYMKDETTNPTGAFLDRGVSVEVSAAKEIGLKSLCCGSTGNLAASLVAYSARAGIETRVFLAQKGNVDTGKLYQILAYGARIELVRDQTEATSMALREGVSCPAVTASNPYFLEGVKTTAYEICEQLDWIFPHWIIVPMGNGGHIARVWKALRDLLELGLIEGDLPRLVGTQARGCAPIVDAFDSSSREIQQCRSAGTIAIDIGVREPLCGREALSALRESSGLAIAVTDNEILRAAGLLARLEGVFAEPASATTIAALEKLLERGIMDPSDNVVGMITGMGLKYPEMTRSFVRGKTEIENLLSRVEERRYTTPLGKTKHLILQILSEGESYGYDVWKLLRERHGFDIRIPSVYQHLRELREGGLVLERRSERTFSRRIRHYYAISDRGRWTLSHLQELASAGTGRS
jgi:threonine synthase